MHRRRSTAVLILLLLVVGGGVVLIYRDGLGLGRIPGGITSGFPEPLTVPELSLPEPAVPDRPVAHLVGLRNSVKTRRSESIAWQAAHPRMSLFENDAVRTYSSSSARISFGRGDEVEVGENALVLITPRPQAAPRREISMAVLSSSFLPPDASTRSIPESVRKTAMDQAFKLKPAPGQMRNRGTMRVEVQPLPDRSTEIEATRGDVALTGPRGDSVVLREKMVTLITPQSEVLAPRYRPGAPSPIAPEDGLVLSYRARPPMAELSWTRVQGADSYRIVLGEDEEFRSIVADERENGTSYTIHHLPAGSWLWRVQALDSDGFSGPWSQARTIVSAFDGDPPLLALNGPGELSQAGGPEVEISGRTDPGAGVEVNGEPVEVGPEGLFSTSVKLDEGVNLIVVQASDRSGNTRYRSRIVNYRGEIRSRLDTPQELP